MPLSALRPCARSGCPNLTPRGQSYCNDHLQPTRRERRYHFYGDTSWREFRARYLARHPTCCKCGAPADRVDHIVPVAHGGAMLEEANCRPMCLSCHQSDSARFDGGFGNPIKVKRDAW